MKKASMKIVNRSLSTKCSIIVTLILAKPFCLMGQDNNADIYNQLYEEIINSSGNRTGDKLDSMRSPENGAGQKKPVLQSENTVDIVNERLKTEMEKIIKDAQLRHSDAVRFIQETK